MSVELCPECRELMVIETGVCWSCEYQKLAAAVAEAARNPALGRLETLERRVAELEAEKADG